MPREDAQAEHEGEVNDRQSQRDWLLPQKEEQLQSDAEDVHTACCKIF